MTPAYLLEGRTIRLCRWAAKVTEDGVTRVKGFVDKPEGLEARPLEQSDWAWADGAYLPAGYTPEDLFALGEAGYRTLVLKTHDQLLSAIEKGLSL